MTENQFKALRIAKRYCLGFLPDRDIKRLEEEAKLLGFNVADLYDGVRDYINRWIVKHVKER